MKLCLSVLLLFFAFSATAQDEGIEEALSPRILALDAPILIAQKFNEQIATVAVGYNLAFIDDERKPTIRYVYKNEKNQTLRIDYRYIIKEDTAHKGQKKYIINLQRICADLPVITDIYNYLFRSNLSYDAIMTAASIGSPINYKGNNYQFTFQADDYDPGYWVMTFTR
jgi:hypothetical protein